MEDFTAAQVIELIKSHNNSEHFTKAFLNISISGINFQNADVTLTEDQALAYMLWVTHFKSDSTIVIISKTDIRAKDTIARITEMTESLGFIGSAICVKRSREIAFDNGSKIRAFSQGAECIMQGLSPNIVYLQNATETSRALERNLFLVNIQQILRTL